jgi:hypothetical protein
VWNVIAIVILGVIAVWVMLKVAANDSRPSRRYERSWGDHEGWGDDD